MPHKNAKSGNGTGHKGGAQGSGKDGEAKKAQRIATEAAVKATKLAENARKAAAKAANKPKTFEEVFNDLVAEQSAKNFDLFTGSCGEYAVQVREKKMIVKSFENEKGIQFECLSSNFGFTNEVFLGENLVLGLTVEKFTPNFNLTANFQLAQKELHGFLRSAYEKSPIFAAKQNHVAKPSSPAKLSLVKKVPLNIWEQFAGEEATRSSIVLLVSGGVHVYRIADANGKYAVFSCTSQGNDVKVIHVTLKFLQNRHELTGKVPLETMCELHKLRKETLGNPFGEHKTQMENQGKLHAWLRSRALAAGMKDKKPVAHRKVA